MGDFVHGNQGQVIPRSAVEIREPGAADKDKTGELHAIGKVALDDDKSLAGIGSKLPFIQAQRLFRLAQRVLSAIQPDAVGIDLRIGEGIYLDRQVFADLQFGGNHLIAQADGEITRICQRDLPCVRAKRNDDSGRGKNETSGRVVDGQFYVPVSYVIDHLFANADWLMNPPVTIQSRRYGRQEVTQVELARAVAVEAAVGTQTIANLGRLQAERQADLKPAAAFQGLVQHDMESIQFKLISGWLVVDGQVHQRKAFRPLVRLNIQDDGGERVDFAIVEYVRLDNIGGFGLVVNADIGADASGGLGGFRNVAARGERPEKRSRWRSRL